MAQLDNGKEQYWRRMVRRWERSKQTVRAFCGDHGLSEPSFYAWRRTLTQRAQLAAEGQPGVRPAFVPVRVVADATPAGLEVVAASGRVVRVPPDFDPAMLRRLLAALEEATPC